MQYPSAQVECTKQSPQSLLREQNQVYQSAEGRGEGDLPAQRPAEGESVGDRVHGHSP